MGIQDASDWRHFIAFSIALLSLFCALVSVGADQGWSQVFMKTQNNILNGDSTIPGVDPCRYYAGIQGNADFPAITYYSLWQTGHINQVRMYKDEDGSCSYLGQDKEPEGDYKNPPKNVYYNGAIHFVMARFVDGGVGLKEKEAGKPWKGYEFNGDDMTACTELKWINNDPKCEDRLDKLPALNATRAFTIMTIVLIFFKFYYLMKKERDFKIALCLSILAFLCGLIALAIWAGAVQNGHKGLKKSIEVAETWIVHKEYRVKFSDVTLGGGAINMIVAISLEFSLAIWYFVLFRSEK